MNYLDCLKLYSYFPSVLYYYHQLRSLGEADAIARDAKVMSSRRIHLFCPSRYKQTLRGSLLPQVVKHAREAL